MPIRRFSPGFLILTLIFVALTLSLGFWQLDRAGQKRELIDMFEKRAETSRPLIEVIDRWEEHRYQRVETQGNFLPDKQIFLENQVHQGQVGYHLYIPFSTDNGEIILVNTGWQKPLEESQAFPTGQRNIEGLIRPPPEVGLRLGNLEDTVFDRPYRTPYMDIDWVGKRLGLSLEPFVLLLASGDRNAMNTSWSPVSMPPEKHRGYAVTWFSLAVALAILFLVYSFRKE